MLKSIVEIPSIDRVLQSIEYVEHYVAAIFAEVKYFDLKLIKD